MTCYRRRKTTFVIKCYIFGSALLCSLMIAFFGNSYPQEYIKSTLPNSIGQTSQMFTVINLTNIVFTLCSNTCDSTSTLHYIILVNSALGNKVVICINGIYFYKRGNKPPGISWHYSRLLGPASDARAGHEAGVHARRHRERHIAGGDHRRESGTRRPGPGELPGHLQKPDLQECHGSRLGQVGYRLGKIQEQLWLTRDQSSHLCVQLFAGLSLFVPTEKS